MVKPTVTCIITAWKEDPPENMVKQMINQTYPKKQILVYCSDMDLTKLKKKYPDCKFFDVPNRKDWGHSKHRMGIETAVGKYLCTCNADDEYDPKFLEYMVGALEDAKADFAYCVWRDKTLNGGLAEPGLHKGGLFNGSFVVKSSKAKKVGWKYDHYASDWYFVRDLLKEGIQVVYLPYSLVKHN